MSAPRYSTLVKYLDLMVGEVQCELYAAGKEDVMGHPVLRDKYYNMVKAQRVLDRAKIALEKRHV